MIANARWSYYSSYFALIFFFFQANPSLIAQQQPLPLNHQQQRWIQRHLSDPQLNVHTSFKPLIWSKVYTDSLRQAEHEALSDQQRTTWFGRKLWAENFIDVKSEGFRMAINPVFNAQLGRDQNDDTDVNYYRNTRGFRIEGSIGDKFSFVSSVYENQGVFPFYIDNFIQRQQVAPGEGRVKIYRETGWDFAMASGSFSYSPSEHFNIQAGHDKHFIGDGYRSLLLSDNSFNYPFVKGSAFFWKGRMAYHSLHTSMQSVDRIPQSSTPEAAFQRKGNTIHYLTIKPHPAVELGLFEATIWQTWDSTGTRPFNGLALNPLMGVNTASTGFDANNNSLVGLNLKVNPLKNYLAYAQYIYDDESRDGYQIGFRFFDLFTLRNLGLQLEYNDVSPFTYSHSIPLQNYGHYNQPLAHPLGAGFQEAVIILDYQYKRFALRAKFTQAKYTGSPLSNFAGKNIFVSDDIQNSVVFTQPTTNSNTVDNQDVSLSYIINPNTNMQVRVGVMNRDENILQTVHKTQFVYFSLRTALTNSYYDF